MDLSNSRITGILILIVNLQLTDYVLPRELKKRPHIVVIIADDLVSIIILCLCYRQIKLLYYGDGCNVKYNAKVKSKLSVDKIFVMYSKRCTYVAINVFKKGKSR